MKYTFYKLITGFLLINFYSSCSGLDTKPLSNNESKKKTVIHTRLQKIDFSATILKIEKESVENVTWDGLFGNQDFMKIYENSQSYIDSAINFLSQEQFNIVQKKICINSMQHLRIESYLQFCEGIKDFFDSKKIPESLLEWTLNPNFSKNFLIVRNYDNEKVGIFLKSLLEGNKISKDFRKRIDSILKGETWGQIRNINGY